MPPPKKPKVGPSWAEAFLSADQTDSEVGIHNQPQRELQDQEDAEGAACSPPTLIPQLTDDGRMTSVAAAEGESNPPVLHRSDSPQSCEDLAQDDDQDDLIIVEEKCCPVGSTGDEVDQKPPTVDRPRGGSVPVEGPPGSRTRAEDCTRAYGGSSSKLDDKDFMELFLAQKLQVNQEKMGLVQKAGNLYLSSVLSSCKPLPRPADSTHREEKPAVRSDGRIGEGASEKRFSKNNLQSQSQSPAGRSNKLVVELFNRNSSLHHLNRVSGGGSQEHPKGNTAFANLNHSIVTHLLSDEHPAQVPAQPRVPRLLPPRDTSVPSQTAPGPYSPYVGYHKASGYRSTAVQPEVNCYSPKKSPLDINDRHSLVFPPEPKERFSPTHLPAPRGPLWETGHGLNIPTSHQPPMGHRFAKEQSAYRQPPESNSRIPNVTTPDRRDPQQNSPRRYLAAPEMRIPGGGLDRPVASQPGTMQGRPPNHQLDQRRPADRLAPHRDDVPSQARDAPHKNPVSPPAVDIPIARILPSSEMKQSAASGPFGGGRESLGKCMKCFDSQKPRSLQSPLGYSQLSQSGTDCCPKPMFSQVPALSEMLDPAYRPWVGSGVCICLCPGSFEEVTVSAGREWSPKTAESVARLPSAPDCGSTKSHESRQAFWPAAEEEWVKKGVALNTLTMRHEEIEVPTDLSNKKQALASGMSTFRPSTAGQMERPPPLGRAGSSLGHQPPDRPLAEVCNRNNAPPSGDRERHQALLPGKLQRQGQTNLGAPLSNGEDRPAVGMDAVTTVTESVCVSGPGSDTPVPSAMPGPTDMTASKPLIISPEAEGIALEVIRTIMTNGSSGRHNVNGIPCKQQQGQTELASKMAASIASRISCRPAREEQLSGVCDEDDQEEMEVDRVVAHPESPECLPSSTDGPHSSAGGEHVDGSGAWDDSQSPARQDVCSSTSEEKKLSRGSIDNKALVEGRRCQICNDSASGFHYGVWSCEGCKAFFKRSLQGPVDYMCPATNNCTIDKHRRKSCQACRLRKCLEMGMSRGNPRKEKGTRAPRQMKRKAELLQAESLEIQVKKEKRTGSGAGSVEAYNSPTSQPSQGAQGVAAAFSSSCPAQSPPNPPDGAPPSEGCVEDPPPIHPLVEHLMKIDPPVRFSNHDTTLPDTEEHLMDSMLKLADSELLDVINWAKSIPGYSELSLSDRIHLLEVAWMEVLVLGLLWRSLPYSDTLAFAPDLHFHRDRYSSMSWAMLMGRMLHLVQSLKELRLNREEMVLLRAMILLNAEAKTLESRERIKEIQSQLNEALHYTTLVRHRHDYQHLMMLMLVLPHIRQASMRSITTISSSNRPPIYDLLREMLEGNTLQERTDMHTPSPPSPSLAPSSGGATEQTQRWGPGPGAMESCYSHGAVSAADSGPRSSPPGAATYSNGAAFPLRGQSHDLTVSPSASPQLQDISFASPPLPNTNRSSFQGNIPES